MDFQRPFCSGSLQCQPLLQFHIYLKWVSGSFVAGKKSVKITKGWQIGKPQLPICFVSGKDDPCMISEEKFKESVSFLKKAGYQNVSY